MSFFSNALAKLTEGRSLAEISQTTGISQQMLSSYRSGSRGIKPASLAKLVTAFSNVESAELVSAHLRDECPPAIFEQLSIQIGGDGETAEPPKAYQKDKEFAVAHQYLGERAQRDPNLRHLLIGLYQVLH